MNVDVRVKREDLDISIRIGDYDNCYGHFSKRYFTEAQFKELSTFEGYTARGGHSPKFFFELSCRADDYAHKMELAKNILERINHFVDINSKVDFCADSIESELRDFISKRSRLSSGEESNSTL